MKHVIDVGEAGTEAAVLTDSGSGRLIGRGLLSENELAAYLDDDETPAYVLRNKKNGLTVEYPDETVTYKPDGSHSGLGLITDVRLFFAVGRSDGDRTTAVPLGDVVDVRIENGLFNSALVVETVDDATYRFPCRGDLKAVCAFVDASVGTWSRAERRLERAREQCDELRSALDSGDFDAVIAGVADVTESLEDAQKHATGLDGASARIEDRADALRADLDALRRRAHTERAEQARERAHLHWDDHDFQAACDHFDQAMEDYETAADIDGDRPGGDLLTRRLESLAAECGRLVHEPVERADHAAEVARSTDDPGAAVDWWQTAVERYETALFLDWGRVHRRFDGDVDRLRDALVEAARSLVDAHCRLARQYVERGDEARPDDPADARLAYDLATNAIEDAYEVARERAPDTQENIERVETVLKDRWETLPAPDETAAVEHDGGQNTTTPTASKQTNVDPEGSDRGDQGPAHGQDTGAETDQESFARGGAGAAADGASNPSIDEGEGNDHETGARNDESIDPEVSPGPEQKMPEKSMDAQGEAGDDSAREMASERTVEHTTALDPTTLDPDRFRSLVSDLFRAAGWSTTVFDGSSTRQYDLVVETDSPVGLVACVWTIHPDRVEAVDAASVERCVMALDRADVADAAVLASAAPLSPTARERAADHGVKILDLDSLRKQISAFDVHHTDE